MLKFVNNNIACYLGVGELKVHLQTLQSCVLDRQHFNEDVLNFGGIHHKEPFLSPEFWKVSLKAKGFLDFSDFFIVTYTLFLVTVFFSLQGNIVK